MNKLAVTVGSILTVCAYLAYVSYTAVTFSSAEQNPDRLKPYSDKLAEKLTEKAFLYRLIHWNNPFGKCKTYTVFMKNWLDNEPSDGADVPQCAILWFGSKSGMNYLNLQQFEKVWSSSLLLAEILKAQQVNSVYVPLFTLENKTVTAVKSKIGIIGQPLFIEEILKEHHLPAQYYSFDNPEQIRKDFGKFKMMIIDKADLASSTLDVQPIVLDLMHHNTPILSYWKWPFEDTLNRFNDTVNFYDDREMAERFILETVRGSQRLQKRTQAARQMIEENYSLETAANMAWNSFFKNAEKPSSDIRKVNLDIPTAVGHYTAGDYALAEDLASELTTDKTAVNLTFYNSLFKYKADVNLFMRGFLPVIDTDLTARLNVLYLAYAQFPQDTKQEFVPQFEDYIQKILKDTQNINLIFSASEQIANALNTHGKKAIYLPQFTNTKRFYYDYDETLKSDVLFVGVNSFYRRAVPILHKHHVPVTVYGPKWPDGVAVAPYADNQILRKYYSSAKIVLNDTREGMLKFGFISNRIFDATACGTLVITDYMPEIEKIYGDTVPMWKTEQELVDLVQYYLNHPEERLKKARAAQEITLKLFTAEKAAQTISQEIHAQF